MSALVEIRIPLPVDSFLQFREFRKMLIISEGGGARAEWRDRVRMREAEATERQRGRARERERERESDTEKHREKDRETKRTAIRRDMD